MHVLRSIVLLALALLVPGAASGIDLETLVMPGPVIQACQNSSKAS